MLRISWTERKTNRWIRQKIGIPQGQYIDVTVFWPDSRASWIRPLQLVQNAAARLVLNLDHRPHITPALQQLHWLPVYYRIQYKIATLMHHTYNNTVPTSNLPLWLSQFSSTRSLRSTTNGAAAVQRTRTRLGDPRVWNNLPASPRQTVSAAAFKRQLKTV